MKRNDFLRVKYFLFCLFHRNGYDHGAYLKRHNAFHEVGEKFFFQPYNLPADSKYIRFGKNVVVAFNVHFICHDVIHHMLNNVPESGGGVCSYRGIIDIKDNVFLGANSTILSNVTVGNNTVIAAGSLVNRNVPDGKIVAGVPAKVVGDVADLAKRRIQYSKCAIAQMEQSELLKHLWDGQ